MATMPQEIRSMSTESFKGLEFIPEELEALEKFLRFEISSKELENRLIRVVRFITSDSERRVEPLFRFPEPGIPVAKCHIENALNKKRLGQITERELAEWAAVLLLLNDAYEFDPAHEGDIADWLNDLSWLPPEDQS